MTSSSPSGLSRFNSLAHHELAGVLHAICSSEAWCAALRARHPYATVGDLLVESDEATDALMADDLAEAMAAHPPIGRPEPGDPVSAREQRGMADASDTLRAEMLELNLAYQKRFGHVFLICATGATGERMRDALRSRLTNTPERESAVVRTELGKINRIRLTRLVTEGE